MTQIMVDHNRVNGPYSEFHVGCSPTRFHIIVDWRCSHVDKHKSPTTLWWPTRLSCTKALFNPQVPTTEGLKTLKLHP